MKTKTEEQFLTLNNNLWMDWLSHERAGYTDTWDETKADILSFEETGHSSVDAFEFGNPEIEEIFDKRLEN